MTDDTGFVVEQEHFRGSLSELGQALRRHDLPPESLDLFQLVRAYLAYFEVVAASDLELATEALPRVAQVIELKLRLLLPRPPRAPEDEDDTEALDEALSAVALLEELEDAIRFLKWRRQERRIVLPARTLRPAYPRPTRPSRSSPADLARLAGRYRLGGYFEVAIERLTLAGAMRRVMAALRSKGGGSLFELVGAATWSERTVCFGAMLELVRQGRVSVEQERPFGVLSVTRGAHADAPSDGSDVEVEASADAPSRDDHAARTDRQPVASRMAEAV